MVFSSLPMGILFLQVLDLVIRVLHEFVKNLQLVRCADTLMHFC